VWSSLIIASVLVGVGQTPPRLDPEPSQIAAALEAAGVDVLPPPEAIEKLTVLASVASEAGVLARIETDGDDRGGLQETRSFWGVIGPEWRDTSGAHARSVGECRAALIIDQLDPCREALIPELWVSHAARLQSTIVMRLAMVDALGPIDRERVGSALLTIRDRAVERMRLVIDDEALDDDLRVEALDVGVVLAGIAGLADESDDPE